jgi:pseudaminic acid synthase
MFDDWLSQLVGQDVYVIAEVSANHNQSIETAREIVAAAAATGANAIKFQTYNPDTITIDSTNEEFIVRNGSAWDGRTLHSLYTEGMMPWEWHAELFDLAKSLGMDVFSSPFDFAAVELLESLDVPFYKIASFEITDTRLIQQVARTGKPVIISTGIAELADIHRAVETCHAEGNHRVVVLKCTSTYPAPSNELNLRTIRDMQERFGVIIGFSDHTMSEVASVAAVSLGARVIERHMTLNRDSGGLDSGFSTNPEEFKSLVSSIRETQSALGEITYELPSAGQASRKYARSLYVVVDVQAGETLTEENVASVRPFAGMPAWHWKDVTGKTFVKPVLAGTPLSPDMLS